MYFSKLGREIVIKLVDSKDESTFDIKYGSLYRIPPGTLRLILINLKLDYMLPFKIDKAIERRITLIDIDDQKLY
jgi:hypothetical protein